jgi:hypothetical protein
MMRLLIRIVFFSAFITLYVTIRHLNFKEHSELGSEFEDILDCKLLKDAQNSGKNIFFVDSSGVKDNDTTISATLNSRYACCVESAAAKNPNYNVFVVFVARSKLGDSKQIKALKMFKNVKFVRLDLTTFSKNTPVEQWMTTGKLYKAIFLLQNVSNLVRIMLLWR